MTSIFENTSSPVTIHLLHDETLTQDNREKFIRTAQKYSQEIKFIDISDYVAKYIDDNITSKYGNSYTNGTFFRLFIQYIINIDKVIYFDCDIIVNLDINELWQIDIGDNYIAAILDDVVSSAKKFSYQHVKCFLMGCRVEKYINAGVMVMNLKKLREYKNFGIGALKWMSQHTYITDYADQEVINVFVKDSRLLIDKKFNTMTFNSDSDLSNCIIHGCFRKFWKIPPVIYADRLYWHMFLRSAWGENVNTDELIEIIADLNNPNESRPKLSILRRVIRSIKHRFKYRFKKLIDIPVLVIKDIYYRIKYKFSR